MIVYCPNCEKDVSQTDRKCKHCGFALQVPEKKKVNVPDIIIAALGNKKIIISIIVIAAFILGYFTGRVHLMFQIADAVTDTVGEIDQEVDGLLGNSVPKPDESNKVKPDNYKTLGVFIIKKGYRELDMDKRKPYDAITITLSLTNTLDKDLRAFEGMLFFNDILDNTIKVAKYSYTKPLKSGEAVTWSGEMKYDQFNDDDQALLKKEVSDLKVTFILRKVLYSDGTKEEFWSYE